MFASEKLTTQSGPTAILLSAPNDPLGSIAACAKMYLGEVVRDLADITDAERHHYLEQMQNTKLKMPLEAVQMHFMLEGVTRGFTHQMVRQRTAAYAQESMRFAVVEDKFSDRVVLPPSLVGVEIDGGYADWLLGGKPKNVSDDEFGRLSEDQKNLVDWLIAVNQIEKSYQAMVNRGMPAEDARGLLPTNIATRLNYITNFRGLLDHAGNRLCTQAQFEWRLVLAKMAEAIRAYGHEQMYRAPAAEVGGKTAWMSSAWQFDALADLLRPVCYQVGSCVMKADFDRACSIRNRVDANAKIGRSSAEWGEEYDEVEGNPIVVGVGPQSVVTSPFGDPVFIGAIQAREWLADPGAAR